MLAQGVNPKRINKNLIDLKDVDGKYFVRDYIELASRKGNGWVDFKWPIPITKTLEQKWLYVGKVNDMVIGRGIYR